MTATDELRGYALSVRNIALRTTSLCHGARRDLLDSAVRMEQAADTIESLRDLLQPVPAELDCIEDKSRWFQMFGTPERAVRTIQDKMLTYDLLTQCDDCPYQTDECFKPSGKCAMDDYDTLLGWLRKETE